MHLQEVFNAIYINHVYEYVVIDHQYQIVEFSDMITEYCENEHPCMERSNVFNVFPELIGLENEIQNVFTSKDALFTLPHILKKNGLFINIHIHPGRINKAFTSHETTQHDTLIILLENVTKQTQEHRNLVQERNDKTLLLGELELKNRQLEEYGTRMQELVDKEVRKNFEKQRLIELQSRHAQMGEMMGMITHQWKQPVNAINMMCNVLQMKRKKGPLDSAEFDRVAANVQNQIDYMMQTVNDFQRFFKPSLHREMFNVTTCIQEVISLVGDLYALENIHIDLSGDDTVEVKGYLNDFKQVLLSVFSNARDAFREHPNASMRIKIDVVQTQEGRAQVTVSDNAGGIPENIIGTIFEAYTSTKENGTGIGLNIAKTLIEDKMEGTISVRNHGDGAEFTIVI
jgi:signal transduction histidine kinase